ncbi:MAG TPA: hypothetical protein PK971_08795 [Saprospiraceae bacterium]|nr:hypothetical protein [Saprospiraceae bacterium]HND88413.1 hypothetical protein [Saprospiraceae bacterium]
MLGSKSLTLLQSLTKTELNRLRKFIRSPWFNDSQDLTRFFDLLHEALRQGEAAVSALDKVSVWAALFPSKPYDDAAIRRLSSDFTQLALRFLLEEQRSQDALGEALALQKILNRPELRKHLAGVERQVLKQLEASGGKSPEYYLAHFQMHWNGFTRSAKSVSTADYFEKLWPANEHLEAFYVVQKLKMYLSWRMFRKVRAAEQDLEMPPGFWQQIERAPYCDIPLVALYKHAVKCLEEPEEEAHFQALLDDLRRYAPELTQEDLREGYHIAQNYCALKINQGYTDYYGVLFRLFQDIIRLQILLENNALSEGVFKNIITISLVQGEYAWAEAFIRDYAGFLPSDIRDNAYTFNLANLYFHQRKYPAVIELLRNVEYSDVVYTLGSKLLLLRTYYETDEVLALDSLMDSFRIYVRRNKLISKDLKREYINFLNFLKRLMALSVASPQAVAAFREKVSASKNPTIKKWLLEKIGELE